MKIGVCNNYTREGKKNIKKYFESKNYNVIDCDKLVDTIDFNLEKKECLDNLIKEKISIFDNVVIDFNDLLNYKDYVDICDYIVNIDYTNQTVGLGVERVGYDIIEYSPDVKYYHKKINYSDKNWVSDLEKSINFNFNNNIKVSIIVPIYNVSLYLSKCINSIIHQSYKNIEVLLIDDGSTDNSLDIARKFSKMDSRVKIYHKKNGGLASARNYGLSKASGNYIMYVDSDDYIDNNMVELLLKKILKENADICEGGIFVHNKDNTIVDIHEILNIDKKETRKKELVNKHADGVINIAVWNKMYKHESIKNIKFNTKVFKEDSDYTLRLCLEGLSVTQVPIPLYHYIKRGSGSLTGDKFSPRFFNLANWCETMVKNILKEHADYNDITDKLLFNSYIHILKYYLRDFNKGVLEKDEYSDEIITIYNKLVKLIINTEDVTKYKAFDNVSKILHLYISKGIINEKDVYKQSLPCIGIIWNSLNNNHKQEILDKISKIGNIKYFINVDFNDKYQDFIKDIYVENHEAEGVPFIKYATLKDQFDNNYINIVYANIDVNLYEYTDDIKGFQFESLATLKRNIREYYKTKISKYAFDNIFHLTMNEAEYKLTNDIVTKYLERTRHEK